MADQQRPRGRGAGARGRARPGEGGAQGPQGSGQGPRQAGGLARGPPPGLARGPAPPQPASVWGQPQSQPFHQQHQVRAPAPQPASMVSKVICYRN